jgi:hypothetical protein
VVTTFARYDYAWKTPGWTVQNPTITMETPSGYWDPGLPDDVSKVLVLGRFLDLMTGRALEGHLSVRASEVLTYTPTGSLVLPAVEGLRFRDGDLSLTLPATDDAQLTPNGWKYHFRLRVQENTFDWEAELPSSPSPVDIQDLMP